VNEFESDSAVLAKALALSGQERIKYLDEACAGRDALRGEIESLLDTAARAHSFLDHSPLGSVEDAPEIDDVQPGTVLDGYEIGAQVGEGGMGAVYRAEQREPLARSVAIKVIKPGMDSRSVLARFRAEQRTLGRLSHPNIAQVFGAGMTKLGRPYFVMELIGGLTLTDWCRTLQPSRAVRMSVFRAVCEGVGHAHRRGFIHRDLKPGNVLVQDLDGQPVPKIIDFGIARAIADEGHANTRITMRGGILGTPEYMAPEQRVGDAQVDTRADVYALGVMLVEMLTGAPPERRGDASLVGTGLRGELDWIARRCLEPDRESRYGSVDALLADLGNLAAGLPVSAGPTAVRRRVRAFVRRHRVQVSAIALIFLALAIGLSAALAALARERAQARRAISATEFLREMFARIDPEVARTRDRTLLRDVLDEAASRLDSSAVDPLVEADLRSIVGRGYAVLGEIRAAEPHLARALLLGRDILGADAIETLLLQSHLSNVLKDLGRLDEAESMARQNVEGARSRYGEASNEWLGARNNLASILIRAREFTEARSILEDVLARRESRDGVDAESVIVVLSNLATIESEEGRHEDAARLRRRQLVLSRRHHGNEHPRTLTALINYATSLERLERTEDRPQVLELREEALALARAVHGPSHLGTFAAMNNLASLYRTLGRRTEAAWLLEEIIDRAPATLGEGHIAVVAARKNLADVCADDGRLKEAFAQMELAMRGAWESLPERHPLRGVTVVESARILSRLGRTREAIALLDEKLPEMQRILGGEDPLGATSLRRELATDTDPKPSAP